MKKSGSTRLIRLLIVIALALLNLNFSFAETISYQYDELNRIIRAEDASSGSVVEYEYDAVGNRTQKKTTITAGSTVPFLVTVRSDAQTAMPGVNTYLFRENGSYMGKAQITGENGGVQFDVSRGTYKVRADYLGYQYWSDAVLISAATSIDLTIPHRTVNITVNSVYQGSSTPLSGINVYLFSPANAYLGLHQPTGSDGRASFLLPDKEYKVRADYLGQQYFSALFTARDASVNIPMADAEITVIQGGQPVSKVKVYAFSPAGSYLGITYDTDAFGKATFRLPAASYKFRADYLGNKYWSSTETLVADQPKPVLINTGGGSFTLTVLKGADPMAGVRCYVFNEAGSYLGLSGTTNVNGQVSYNLADGNYKFRVDYLGSQHWSEVATVPTLMSLTKTIAHQAVTVTVMGSLAGNGQLKVGVPVYLFSPSGSYLSIRVITDAGGRAVFNLPQQPCKVRADYLGRQFWSDVFTWEDKIVFIPEGTARVHLTMAGQDIQGAPVYVFNSGGTYLGISGKSSVAGVVEFQLPAGAYKFRADYQGGQFWATADISQDTLNTVELSTGGGQFTLAIDTGSGPLAGVRTYVFTSAGSYLGLYADSNAGGQASFILSSGSYKFRVDYLGYQFWSEIFSVPDHSSGALPIPHQDIMIAIEGVYQGSQPVAGVKVYLFTPAGSYLGKMKTTDSSGQATFNLPNKSFKVRADYLGYQFWSDPFQYQNALVAIQRGVAQIMAKKNGNPVSGVPVYLFSSGGSYLGLSAMTNAEDKAEFLLPNRSYKFRADAGGVQHWSAVTTIVEEQINPIEVNLD